MSNTQQLQDFTTQVRRDILRMVHAVNSGHPGGSLGCAEFLVTLYQDVMKRNEGFDMNGIGEDLFFLSNGHISPVFYSVLARAGYFPVEELKTFTGDLERAVITNALERAKLDDWIHAKTLFKEPEKLEKVLEKVKESMKNEIPPNKTKKG
jgi:transketolase N-terminal domain/subunit